MSTTHTIGTHMLSHSGTVTVALVTETISKYTYRKLQSKLHEHPRFLLTRKEPAPSSLFTNHFSKVSTSFDDALIDKLTKYMHQNTCHPDM